MWAIMLEQAIQALESVLGPLLEAVLCDHLTMGRPPQKQHLGLQMPAAALAAAAAFASAAAEAAGGTRNKPPSPLPRHPAAAPAVPPPPQGPLGSDAGTRFEDALVRLGLPLPPLDAAACVMLLLKSEWLCSSKFPITIKRRLETVEAVSAEQASKHLPLLPPFPSVLIGPWSYLW
jgi:hypothetical protein